MSYRMIGRSRLKVLCGVERIPLVDGQSTASWRSRALPLPSPEFQGATSSRALLIFARCIPIQPLRQTGNSEEGIEAFGRGCR